MPGGFDLTAIAPPSQQQQMAQPTPTRPSDQPIRQPAPNPEMPTTLNDALTRPIAAANMVDEDGAIYQDKLKKQNPMLHKQLWQIDKFAQTIPQPVQREVVQEDGTTKVIWVDANGNMPVDPDTGAVLLKPRE